MLKYLSIPLLAVFGGTAVNAANCEKELFEQMVKTTHVDYQLPKQTPTAELKAKMEDFEISCPWQITQDFDGDKRRDWIGFVENQGKVSLVGYFSNAGSWKFVDIWQYDSLPPSTHLSFMTVQEYLIVSDHQISLPQNPKFALVVNHLGKPSQVLRWDGTTMTQLGSFEGQF